jgi:hypothetical protein
MGMFSFIMLVKKPFAAEAVAQEAAASTPTPKTSQH